MNKEAEVISSQWKSIESAPEGKEVLVTALGGTTWYVYLAMLVDGSWCTETCELDTVTYWMPLPPPHI